MTDCQQGRDFARLELTNQTEGTETMNKDQPIDESRYPYFPGGRIDFETPALTIAQIVEQAPHPKEFYDRYHEDDLDDIEDMWPGRAGSVYLFSCKYQPDWYLAIQSPDRGLIESVLHRWCPLPDQWRVIATWSGEDRFALLPKVWRKLAKISSERANRTKGRSQMFKITDERIKNDLPALIRSIS